MSETIELEFIVWCSIDSKPGLVQIILLWVRWPIDDEDHWHWKQKIVNLTTFSSLVALSCLYDNLVPQVTSKLSNWRSFDFNGCITDVLLHHLGDNYTWNHSVISCQYDAAAQHVMQITSDVSAHKGLELTHHFVICITWRALPNIIAARSDSANLLLGLFLNLTQQLEMHDCMLSTVLVLSTRPTLLIIHSLYWSCFIQIYYIYIEQH